MISIFNQTYKYTYKIKHIQALTTPSRQETQHAPSLPRGDATEAPVGKVAVPNPVVNPTLIPSTVPISFPSARDPAPEVLQLRVLVPKCR